MAVNLVLRLPPDRRRIATSLKKLLQIAARSDAKQYASGRAFTPIFPTTDAVLQTALTTVMNALNAAITPTPS